MRVSPTTVTLLLLLVCNRQGVGAMSPRSSDSAFDANKGVFSSQGRLLQLDYVEGIVKRGNLCMGAECKDGVVLVTNKLVSADAAELLTDGGVRRIYKVDSHIGILPAGLPADGRALARKAMDYCRSHRREYGEPIPGRVLAERLGEFLHLACVRWGSRAYPNALFIACWGERDRGNENCDSGGGGAHLSGWSPDSSETAEIAVTSEEAGVGVGVGAGAGAGVEVGVGVGGEATSKLGIVAGKQDNGWLRKRRERVGEGDEQEKRKEEKEKKGEVGEEVAGEEEEGDEGEDGEEEGEQGQEKEEREGATTGGMDSGFRLYMVDPSGASRRYKAACTGRGGARARKWLHSSFAGDEDGSGRSWDKKEGDAAEVEEEEEEKGGGQEELEGEDDADAIDGEGSSRDGSEARGQGRAGTDETRQTEKKMRQQHQRRRQPKQPLQQLQRLPPLSHMTCEEAARAMVRRARRVNAEGYGEGGKGGGEGRGVFSVAEVAWLSIETVAGGGEEDRPLFTYHRSVDDLFGGEDEDEDRV